MARLALNWERLPGLVWGTRCYIPRYIGSPLAAHRGTRGGRCAMQEDVAVACAADYQSDGGRDDS